MRLWQRCAKCVYSAMCKPLGREQFTGGITICNGCRRAHRDEVEIDTSKIRCRDAQMKFSFAWQCQACGNSVNTNVSRAGRRGVDIAKSFLLTFRNRGLD